MSEKAKEREAPMSFFSFQDIVACTTGIMVLLTLLLMMELLTRSLEVPPYPTQESLRDAVEEARKRKDHLQRVLEDGRHALNLLGQGKTITRSDIADLEAAIQKVRDAIAVLSTTLAEGTKEEHLIRQGLSAARQDIEKLAQQIKDLERELKRLQDRATVIRLEGKRGDKIALFVECSRDQCVVATIRQEAHQKGVAEEVKRFTGADCYTKFLGWAQTRNPAREYFVLLIRPTTADRWKPLVNTLRSRLFDAGWDVWPSEKRLLPTSS